MSISDSLEERRDELLDALRLIYQSTAPKVAGPLHALNKAHSIAAKVLGDEDLWELRQRSFDYYEPGYVTTEE